MLADKCVCGQRQHQTQAELFQQLYMHLRFCILLSLYVPVFVFLFRLPSSLLPMPSLPPLNNPFPKHPMQSQDVLVHPITSPDPQADPTQPKDAAPLRSCWWVLHLNEGLGCPGAAQGRPGQTPTSDFITGDSPPAFGPLCPPGLGGVGC